jgi:hypothetical protein
MKQKYSSETVELRSNVTRDSVYANEKPIEALAGVCLLLVCGKQRRRR